MLYVVNIHLIEKITMCFFSFGKSLLKIASWWAWNLCSFGNPGMKNPWKIKNSQSSVKGSRNKSKT